MIKFLLLFFLVEIVLIRFHFFPQAAQAAAEQSRQAQQASKKQMHDLPRGGSRGGRNREQPGGDGWSAVGGNSAPPPRPAKAGDCKSSWRIKCFFFGHEFDFPLSFFFAWM